MKRLTVVFALGLVAVTLGVAAGPSGAASGPVVGPAHQVATSQAVDTNFGGNGIGSAFDGKDFFVVWADGRGGKHAADIYGARVTPDGTVLDPSGIPIAASAGRQTQPTVAYAGDHFVVAWEDHGALPNQINAVRISTQGSVLDSSPLVLGSGSQPEIAAAGSTAFVVWKASGIEGGRIGSNGAVLDPGGFAVASDPIGENAFSAPSVASNGTDFLVGYETGTDGNHVVAVTKVSSVGGVGSSVNVAADADDPALASNGTDYLVAYASCLPGCESASNFDITTRMVSTTDLSLSSAVVAATGSAWQQHPDVAFNAGRFLVAYRRQGVQNGGGSGPIDVRSSLLNRTGDDLIAQGVIIERDVYGSDTVTAGPSDDFGVAYEDLPASASPLELRTVSPK